MTIWVLFAGLPGTGKTTLALALAQRLNAAVLDKDRVRASLFPGSLTDYSAAQAQLCMRAMLEAAAYMTDRHQVDYVFIDGRTFSRQADLEEVLTAAKHVGADWRILHLTCADAVAEQRLGHSDPAHPAKNRDPALYQQIKQHDEPLLQPHLQVDTTFGFDGQLEAVEAYLRASD
jgi:predicted kinase